MTGDELREKFLLFFEQRGHKIVPGSSLVPLGDPTLLLTSAGMVQFKPYFTGEAAPPSPRLASCQKCFRATDMASVGNLKHLTFFEMLGNFSIGDYFKKEAIAWAWEFVIDWLKLPKEKLWVTIFLDDDEAFHHWREVGVEAERIGRYGEKDNFWGPAGESGPCGPCSEIHYDYGEEYGCGPDCSPACDCERFLELWNLVFTEYFQDSEGKRTPLPRKNIDTGMGLERTAAVLQGKRSFYETDLFASIVQRVSELTGRPYGEDEKTDRAIRIVAEHGRAATFLIADGVIPSNEGRGYVLRRVLRRAAYFGHTLSREKPFLGEVAKEAIATMGHMYPELEAHRELVLRVIGSELERSREALLVGGAILEQTFIKLRRNVADSFSKFEKGFEEVELSNSLAMVRRHLSGAEVGGAIDDFERNLVELPVLIIGGRDIIEEVMAPIYSDLEVLKHTVATYDGTKPNAFSTLKQDVKRRFQELKEHIQFMTNMLFGCEIFALHGTYGFPAELTAEVAAENGLMVDLEGFEKEMERERERARAAVKVTLRGRGTLRAKGTVSAVHIPSSTDFVGHERTRCKAKVISLAVDGASHEEAHKGQQVEVVLDKTPFYAEMGGQVADTGEIIGRRGGIAISDTVWAGAELVVHRGQVVRGSVFLGEEVTAVVDQSRRLDIARNHTATHLLQAALRRVLGSHVHQMGSLVAPDHFRFDFSFEAPVLKEELDQIQRIVNDGIRQNLSVTKKDMPHTQAVAQGAIALFGEKYGDVVRVVRIGRGRSAVSLEVCGGTHVNRTGDIGFFHILSEGSIGSGMRRIEAVTGSGAEALIEERVSTLEKIAHQLQVPTADVEDKLGSVLQELDAERKRAIALERQLSQETAESLLAQVESVNGVSVLAASVPASNIDVLRHMGDILRERLGSAVIVLGAVWADRPNFLAMVTSDLVARGLNAGDIVKEVAREAGGSGGGRPQLGQGGGKDKDRLEQALKLVAKLVRGKV